MILKAAMTCCIVAPPPMSRKFAGSPPCNLMISMVAMARPAPFTGQQEENRYSQRAVSYTNRYEQHMSFPGCPYDAKQFYM